MSEYTGVDAKNELRQLSLPELLELAIPFGGAEGMTSEQLIDKIMGECTGCKKPNHGMTVIYQPMVVENKIYNQPQTSQPCVNCGKMK